MKRVSCAFVSLIIFLTSALCVPSGTVFASSSDREEQQDAQTVRLYVSCDNIQDYLLTSIADSNQYTRYYASEDTHLKFTAYAPVKSLYVMIDKPFIWTLTLPGGDIVKGGENEYLHEYIALDKETTSFEIDIPAGGSISNVYAFTDGRIPDWVQIWQPPCRRADLMVMPTHADDEYLWFGGAIPYYAGELGYNVQVVYLTYHSKQKYRCHELLNGLWKVGVRNYPIIAERFIDTLATKWSMESAEKYFGRDNVTEFQVEMLRRFAPRVIIAHDINGEYGHGAHILNASTLLDALQIYEDASVYPESAQKYGIHKVQKCYLHLWNENQITVQWSEKKLGNFGGRSALDMAREGYYCHRSQQKWENHMFQYGAYDCRKFGLAYTTVGYDSPGLNDMFENVDWYDKTKAEIQDEAEANAAQNADSQENTPETLSASDKKSGSRLKARNITLSLFGRKIMIQDIVVAATAMVISLVSIIIVICLKKRE